MPPKCLNPSMFVAAVTERQRQFVECQTCTWHAFCFALFFFPFPSPRFQKIQKSLCPLHTHTPPSPSAPCCDRNPVWWHAFTRVTKPELTHLVSCWHVFHTRCVMSCVCIATTLLFSLTHFHVSQTDLAMYPITSRCRWSHTRDRNVVQSRWEGSWRRWLRSS